MLLLFAVCCCDVLCFVVFCCGLLLFTVLCCGLLCAVVALFVVFWLRAVVCCLLVTGSPVRYMS